MSPEAFEIIERGRAQWLEILQAPPETILSKDHETATRQLFTLYRLFESIGGKSIACHDYTYQCHMDISVFDELLGTDLAVWRSFDHLDATMMARALQNSEILHGGDREIEWLGKKISSTLTGQDTHLPLLSPGSRPRRLLLISDTDSEAM